MLIPKSVAKYPWYIRLAFATPIALLLSWGAMRWSVAMMMENFSLADPEENEISYDSTFLQWNGDFGARNFKLDHYAPDGTLLISIAADRMVVHTPGLHWLWWSAYRGGSKTIPSDIGVTFENLRDLARKDDTPGNYTSMPYDQVGCGAGKSLLTPARLHEMGLAQVRRDVTLQLHEKDDETSTLSLDLLTHDASELNLSMDIRLQRPVKWWTSLLSFKDSSVTSAQLRLKDLGFVGMRNAYCAKAAGLDANAYRAYYARALAQRLDEVGFRFNEEALSRFRQFSDKGGELVFTASRPAAQPLTKFAMADLDKQILMMPAVVSYNGEREVPFHLDVRLPGEIVAPSTAVAAAAAPAPAPATPSTATATAAPAATTTPVAPSAPAIASAAPKQPAPASAAPQPAAMPGGELSYKDLQNRIGAHVEIVTRNGTVRRGTLLGWSPFLSSVKLDADQGGFTLSVPGDSVEVARAVAPDAVATSASAAAPTP